MTMLTALSILFGIAATLALFVFDYVFNRYMGNEDTDYLAAVMHEINHAEPAAPAKSKAAGAA